MIKRRGISSVVGTVFAIIALASTVGYITYSMNVLDNYNQSILARNQQAADITKEKFQVNSVTVVNNKLNITVVNTGSLPVNFTKIWITNKSATTTAWVKSYTPTNSLVAPGNTLTNLGINGISTWLNTNYPYHVKLVTSRGNTNEFDVTSAAAAPLDIRLYALPPTIPSSFSTELVMIVINNSTNGATLANIIPQLIDQGGTATASLSSNAPSTPPSYSTLAPGQSAYFRWDLTLTGVGGNTHTFAVQLQNGYPANTATTTVSIVTVPVSLQSGGTVQSLGLSSSETPITQLVLHKETNTNPSSTYQLWNGSPENGGTTTYTGTTTTNSWITNNDSSTTVNVNPGSWNLSLRYASDKVPNNFPTADLIYHFETAGSPSKDSSGNTEDLTITGSPTFQGGVNGSNAFLLSGTNQYFSHSVDSHSNVVNTLASTAGWFKTSNSISSQRSIFHIGSTAGNPFYDISLSSVGKVVFSFSGKSTGASSTSCTSSGSTRYDDQIWHHFVAVKTSLNGCSLYVDTLPATTGTGNCIGTCNVAPPGSFYVGNDPTTSNSYFSGTVDDVMHWNAASLTQSQVTTLLHTSYGTNAHKLNITIERDDSKGNLLQTIKSDTNYPIPFYDSIVGGSTYCKTNCNYTTGSLGSFTFGNSDGNGDRLKLKMTWSSGLNMTIDIDDNTLSNPSTTFLQTPTINNAFPSYLTYSLGSNGPILYIQNQGPSSAWISTLTRLSFKDLASTNSYGSMIATANDTGNGNSKVTSYRDSLLIKAGQVGNLVFTQPTNPPCNPAVPASIGTCSGITTIPTGNYKLYAFMSGYDDLGNIFLRTVYIGTVKVIP